MRAAKYQRGDTIYIQETNLKEVFWVASGKGYLEGDTYIEFKAGDVLAIYESLNNVKYMQTAICTSEVVLYKIDKNEISKLMLSDKNFAKACLMTLCKYLNIYNSMVRQKLGKSHIISPDKSLFELANKYKAASEYEKAAYIYKALIKNYPESDYKEAAEEEIRLLEYML